VQVRCPRCFQTFLTNRLAQRQVLVDHVLGGGQVALYTDGVDNLLFDPNSQQVMITP
jgi:hypothetical protein